MKDWVRGLSPRVRGNLLIIDEGGAGLGSIPASAGEPAPPPTSGPPLRVYPRECGGTLEACAGLLARAGLSPRVRGNLDRHLRQEHRDGSIPASAGEPCLSRAERSSRRVYPRECGGTLVSPPYSASRRGLSPRVRGNRAEGRGGREGLRSIPASAGEPRLEPVQEGRWWVYPRECGGTRSSSCKARISNGLSPRVRGNPWSSRRSSLHRGSIPASAGEPTSRRPARDGRRVYPRECGGTWAGSHPTKSQRGLSPRVRGNRRPASPAPGPSRSIPASAGEPGSLLVWGSG